MLRFGIDEFIDKLGQLFREHKVSHIYRASVIAWFQKQGMTTGSVLSWLRTIEGLGLYLHLRKMCQKPLIYELRPEEESLLRQRLAARP